MLPSAASTSLAMIDRDRVKNAEIGARVAADVPPLRRRDRMGQLATSGLLEGRLVACQAGLEARWRKSK